MVPFRLTSGNPAVAAAFFAGVAAFWWWLRSGDAPRPRRRASDRSPAAPPVEPAIPKPRSDPWTSRQNQVRYLPLPDAPEPPDPLQGFPRNYRPRPSRALPKTWRVFFRAKRP